MSEVNREEEREYPASQDEARTADAWRFHYGSICPAECDEVYYRRKGFPMDVLGPTPPDLIRWTQIGDASDILAWHPVYSAHQRLARLALRTGQEAE